MITPVIDPDDVVYPDVEYVTFQATINDMTLVASNPENSNEYTIVTTGGPLYLFKWLSCRKKVLPWYSDISLLKVLSYKYSGVLRLPDSSEANSTTIEFPAAEEWTTFEQDYTAGMATVGWGNSGDYMRCDFGTNADVTINIRNIRFK